MSRNPLARLLVLSLALVLAACAAYQAQHQRPPAPPAALQGTAPDPVPPTGDFSELPPDLQISRIRGEIAEARNRLAQQGRYACCVDPPCNQCLLQYGRCGCREAIRKGGADFCGECTEGWVEGRGIVEGVDVRELLERRRKAREVPNREGGGEPPPQHRHHHH
jgi:hypothetical protein